jgi:hypothetical protein
MMDLSPEMVYPMHGSCIDKSMFSKYTDALIKNNFVILGCLIRTDVGNDKLTNWKVLL